MRLFRILALVLGLLLMLGAPVTAFADTSTDNSFNLVTSPLPISLVGTPGTMLNTEIRVKNGGTSTEKLKVSLMKFSAFGDTGKPAIADRGPGDTYFDWVSFSPQTFDAPSNEWITVKMTIKLPSSAAFGYYYAVVFSRANAPQPTAKTNTLVGSAAVLVLVEAKVPGAKRVADIASFTADKHLYEFLPTTFNIKVHNSGNVHLVPLGNIFISRGGKAVATLNVNKAGGNILPKSNRIFTSSWSDGFPVYAPKQANGQVVLDSADHPESTLQWDFAKLSKLRFGHYTAHLSLAYDNGERDVPLDAEVSFWVIPWRIIFLIIAIPTVPAILVFVLMQRRTKRQRVKFKAQTHS